MQDEPTSKILNASEFERSRRRDPFPPGFPVEGFGPEGLHTLWLVSPVQKSRIAFKGGEANRVVTEPIPLPPRAMELSRVVLKSFENKGDRFTVDLRFLDYAAAVITHSYNVNDADLEMLLLGGSKWHEKMLRHMISGGNDELVAKLSTLSLPSSRTPPLVSRRRPSKPPRPKWKRMLGIR